MSAELWRKALALLMPTPKDKDDARNTMNRLAREHFPGEDFAWIDEKTCDIAYRVLTPAELARIEPWHPRANPREEDLPLVVFARGDRFVIVDGSNRLNKWRAETPEVSRPAYVVTWRGA